MGRRAPEHLGTRARALRATLSHQLERLAARVTHQVARAVAAMQAHPLLRRVAPSLMAQLPQRLPDRLKALLVALWLLEAFLVCDVVIAFISWLDTPQSVFGATQGPSTISIFAAIVVFPSLILATRGKYRQALESDAQRAATLERAAGYQLTDLERACRILYVQPDVPLHIAQAAYAAAMKRHHPDVAAGDDSTAKELNWAIETIREHARIREQLGSLSGKR